MGGGFDGGNIGFCRGKGGAGEQSHRGEEHHSKETDERTFHSFSKVEGALLNEGVFALEVLEELQFAE